MTRSTASSLPMLCMVALLACSDPPPTDDKGQSATDTAGDGSLDAAGSLDALAPLDVGATLDATAKPSIDALGPDTDQCQLDGDCPATGDPCRAARCTDAHQCVVFDREGLPCDDGAPCTVDTACQKGKCGGGLDLCECAKDVHCADAPLNLCAGAPFCDQSKLPWRCASNPVSAVVCGDSAGPCVQSVCQPETGKCEQVHNPNGSACEDGDPCTVAEQCQKGECVAKANVCKCDVDADCLSFDDENLCNGTWFCDAATFPRVCRLNTSSIINCAADKDTACSKNTCDPKDGACKPQPAKDGSLCDDGDNCTNGDACAKGACAAGGQDTCSCKSNADCAAKDDGDLCNGTQYCDQSLDKPICKPNPASVISCVSVNDTPCLFNVCYPKVGLCQLTPVEMTEPDCDAGKAPDGTCKRKLLPPGQTSGQVHKCDSNNPCTEDDVCKAGACVGGTDICACTSDAGCESKFGDGDKCNGTLFCNQQTKLCALNPATTVSCPSANDSECSKNACDPASGACVATAVGKVKQVCTTPVEGGAQVCKWQVKGANEPVGENLPCDDANSCTTGEVCDAKGQCAGGTFTCDCKLDSECAAKDDGDVCNGTLFCNKAKSPSVCEHNPATVVSCKSVDDDTCIKNACVAKTGDCKLTPVEDALEVCSKDAAGKQTCSWKVRPVGDPPGLVFCDDGNSCTAKGLCKGGSCAPGAMVCECIKDADCLDKDDGDKCNGTLYCDKSGQQPKCVPNPASVVVCNKDPGSICLNAACNKATGSCGVVAANEDKPCSDGSKCTAQDVCKAGKCAGAVLNCDDGSLCTSDSCQPDKGCVNEANNCSDGNACTLDQCDPKTGKCAFPTAPLDGTTCDADGSACTVNDSCSAGTCKVGAPVKCEIALKDCEKASCVPLTGSNFKCVKTQVSDGAPCADGEGCTVGATCKGGSCEKGNKDMLYATVWPVANSNCRLNALVPLADGSMVSVGGCWTDKEATPGASSWWVSQGKVTGEAGWSPKFAPGKGHAGHRANGVARLTDGALLVAGGSLEPGFELNAKLVRLTPGGQVQWSKHYGKADVDDAALALAARANGSSVLVGYRVVAGKNTPHVWRIAASGQFEAEATLDKWRGEARAVALHAGGDAGVWMSAQGFAGKQLGRLAVMDDKGAVLSDTLVGDVALAWHEAHAIAPAPGGAWVVGGAYSDPSTGNEARAWVAQVDAKGKVRWQTYGKGQSVVQAITVDDSGRIRLGGTSNLSGSNANFWLQATDPLGNVQWSRHIDGGLQDDGRAMVTTDDGGIAMVGSRDNDGATAGAVVRSDAWGHVSCDGAGSCMAKKAADCDDGKTCTVDDCLAVGGCVHADGDGLACDPKDGCATSGSCSQGSCVPQGEGKLFSKSYTEGSLVAFNAVKPLADGFIVAGNTVGEKKGAGTLTRFDASGKRLWHVPTFAHGAKYNYEYRPVEGTSVLAADDGGFYVAGHYWDGQILSSGQPIETDAKDKGSWNNRLARTDASGKVIWSQIVEDPYPQDSKIRSLLAFPDGTIATIGRVHERAAVNRLKSTAALVWATEFELKGRELEGRAAVVVAGGGTVVVGSARLWIPYTKEPSGPFGGLLFKLDNSGKALWHRQPVVGAPAQLRAVVGDGGGGTYAAGFRQLAGKDQAWIMRVGADGAIQWQKFSTSNDFLRPAALALRSDNSVLIAGEATEGIVDKAWLRAVDGRGSVLWDRKHVIGNVTRVDGNPMALLAKDEVVMVATAVIGGKETGALLRLDAWGNASCQTLGKCADKAVGGCDDGAVCTLDSCEAAKGCVHAADPCDDGDACTVDVCDSKAGCKTTPVTCKDGDICSVDSCDPLGGCQHPPAACPDSHPCNQTSKTCKEGVTCDGILLQGRCLKPYCDDRSWFEAQQFCAGQGRHLAVVRSEAESVLIRSTFETACSANQKVWLGTLQDAAKGTDWWLATGVKATWFHWPNKVAPTPTSNYQVVMQNPDGLWVPFPPNTKGYGSGFVCEGFSGICETAPANEGKVCMGMASRKCLAGKCCYNGNSCF